MFSTMQENIYGGAYDFLFVLAVYDTVWDSCSNLREDNWQSEGDKWQLFTIIRNKI